MSVPSPHDALPKRPKPPRRRRSCLLVLLGLLALVILLPVGFVVLMGWYQERQRTALFAELDRDDPGWRLEEIEAGRKVVADADNSALRVLAVHAALTKAGFKSQKRDALLEDLPPEQQLHAIQIAHLHQKHAALAEIRAEARKLKDQSEGRYTLNIRPDWVSTLAGHLQKEREVVCFLREDAMLSAQAEDTSGAVEDITAMLNAARSIGDEPLAISFLVRVACDQVAVAALQRTLAQGQISDAELTRLQALLEREEAEPLLTTCLRGERAGHHQLYAAIRQGNIKLSAINPFMGGPTIPLIDYVPSSLVCNEAIDLRYMTEMLQASKLPLEQQEGAFKQLRTREPDLFYFRNMWFLGYEKFAGAHLRNQANLRCARTALAAERYRLRTKQWPASLEVLVLEKLLPALPLDPYNAQPLHGRARAGGYVVYSVGPDLTDNDGHIDRNNPIAPNTDLGFRLWDVDQRRQPAVAPVEEAKERDE